MAIKLQDNSKPKKPRKPKLIIASKILFGFAVLGFIGCLFTSFSPLAPILIAFPIMVFWLAAIVVPTVCTIGLVWASEGYRNFVIGLNGIIGKIFSGSETIVDTIRDLYPYLSSVALALVVAGFVLSLIATIKHRKEYPFQKRQLIAVSIMLAISIIVVVVGYLMFK